MTESPQPSATKDLAPTNPSVNDIEHSFFPTINKVAPLAPLSWLRLGWRSYRQCFWPSFFYGGCFALAGAVLLMVVMAHPQLVPAVLCGFLLVGAALSLGVYELARQVEAGETINGRQSLIIWQQRKMSLSIFSAVLIVLFIIWLRASFLAFVLYYNGPLLSFSEMMLYLYTQKPWAFIATYFAIGFGFAALSFAFSVISVPLILERDTDSITAMITSTRACLDNTYPLILWAALLAGLSFLGLILFLVGIAFIGPWLGHATWFAYRDLVGRAPLNAQEESGA